MSRKNSHASSRWLQDNALLIPDYSLSLLKKTHSSRDGRDDVKKTVSWRESPELAYRHIWWKYSVVVKNLEDDEVCTDTNARSMYWQIQTNVWHSIARYCLSDLDLDRSWRKKNYEYLDPLQIRNNCVIVQTVYRFNVFCKRSQSWVRRNHPIIQMISTRSRLTRKLKFSTAWYMDYVMDQENSLRLSSFNQEVSRQERDAHVHSILQEDIRHT